MQGNISDLIRYRDQQFIVLSKPPGIPVQDDLTGDTSLLSMAQAYCKHDLYLWNRLDRPASGLVVFAKTLLAINALNTQQSAGKVKKQYLAAVRTPVKTPSGTLVHDLVKHPVANKMIVSDVPVKYAKACQLKYVLIAESDRYGLLLITLKTGRHHQIRAQLGHVGMPVKGDVKYGFRRGNKDRSIHLHAWSLAWTHPTKKEVIQITDTLPDDPVWNAFAIDHIKFEQ